MQSLLYLLMDSEPRCDVLHGCIQQVRAQNLEMSQKAALLAWPPFPRRSEVTFLSSTLTGNLLNRSVNICVVRGLFRLLMKEFRASLKTLVTRSTSKLPVNLNCAGKHQGLNLRRRTSGGLLVLMRASAYITGCSRWRLILAPSRGRSSQHFYHIQRCTEKNHTKPTEAIISPITRS